MNILVTGGAGYIGSHTVRALQQAGYTLSCLPIQPLLEGKRGFFV